MTLVPTTWTADDADPAWRLIEEVFAGPAHPLDGAVELEVIDPERFLVVRDGSDVVATSGSYALTTSLPGGGPVALTGVTWVSVQPTHRRRGLLTAMIDRLLTDAHERGEAVAALFATEGAIYQRFGFGPGSWRLSVTVPRGAALVRPVRPDGLTRVEPSPGALGPLYEEFAAITPGAVHRDAGWWGMRLYDPEHLRHGMSALRCVVADHGYALYRVKAGPDGTGTVDVVELVASTPDAYARLWAFVLDLDLSATVTSRVPLDAPLLHLLAEPRGAQARVVDALWVRPVEVGAALASRAYATALDVVLDVTDPVCPWNEGRWRLSGDPSGATCARTTDPADLALGVADLGAALLGGTALPSRAGAGLVRELTPGALRVASTAFGPLGAGPWCPLTF